MPYMRTSYAHSSTGVGSRASPLRVHTFVSMSSDERHRFPRVAALEGADAAATSEDGRKRRMDDIVDAYRALGELRDQGKCQAIGVGSKDWKAIAAIDEQVKLDWVMLANSLTIYRHPQELLDFVASLNGIFLSSTALCSTRDTWSVASRLTIGSWIFPTLMIKKSPITAIVSLHCAKSIR